MILSMQKVLFGIGAFLLVFVLFAAWLLGTAWYRVPHYEVPPSIELAAPIPTPVEYDEMEYHLAGPAKYVRDGRISFISNNAYTSFPANVEMLFLDAMVIRGGVVDGFALGRLINVSLGLLAACAAGACAAAM